MKQFRLCVVMVLALLPSGTTSLLAQGGPDHRPPLNKTGFQKTVWTFHQHESITSTQRPEQIDRTLIESFGPNNTALDFVQLAHLLGEANIAGIYVVDQAQAPDASPGPRKTLGDRLRMMLDAFASANNDRRIAYTLDRWLRNRMRQATQPDSKSPEAAAEAVAAFWVDWLNDHRDVFTHPNYAKVDGRPIIVTYGGFGVKPEVWGRALPVIEQRAFPVVWILGVAGPAYSEAKAWLPYVDGVTSYGPRADQEKFAAYMRRTYPQKIWQPAIEPNAHGEGYGWSAGADRAILTHRYRTLWDRAIAGDNDSIQITDIAEYQENRHFLPSYQMLTTFWNITKENVSRYQGRPVARDKPELYVTNRIAVMLGEMIEIEVLGFAITSGDQAVTLELRLLDATGEPIYQFPARQVRFDQMKAELFRAPSIELAEHFSVYPELRYTHNGRKYGPFRCRPVRIWVNHCPTEMCWSTPIDMLNPALAVKLRGELESGRADLVVEKGARSSRDARFDAGGVVFGGGVVALEPGPAAELLLQHGPAAAVAVRYESKVLVNGWPTQPLVPNFVGQHRHRLRLPHTPAPLTWVEAELFELEHTLLADGDDRHAVARRRGYHLSLPIHVVRGRHWLEKVRVNVPVLQADSGRDARARQELNGAHLGQIPVAEYRQVQVPRYRVPYFHYRFDQDYGELAFDTSGYQHHGWVGGLADGNRVGAYFHEVGYDFRHLIGGWLPKVSSNSPQFKNAAAVPQYRTDEDGRTYLAFDGRDDRVILPFHTLMPFAETAELVVKPEAIGRRMTLLSGQGHPAGERFMKLRLSLDADLRVVAEFPHSGTQVTSDRPIEADRWSSIAVVNTGEQARIFIDGKPASQTVDVQCWLWHRSVSYMLIGLGTDGLRYQDLAGPPKPLPNSKDHFRGGIREVRLTARALSPEEMLSAKERETQPDRPSATTP